MTYSMVCDQDHDPVTITVEADDDESAVQAMMEKAKAHNVEAHNGEVPEDVMEQKIRDSITHP